MSTQSNRQAKRNRPHVPVDKRKRAVRACVSCRESKKKCILISADQCRICARYGQRCIFEPTPKDSINTLSRKVPQCSNPDIWELVSMDVSKSLHQEHPGINLNPEQLSIISGLFREAAAKNGIGSTIETSSSRNDRSLPLQPASQTKVNTLSQSRTFPIAPAADDMSSASHSRFLAAVSDTIPLTGVRGRDSSVYQANVERGEDVSVLFTSLNQLPSRETADSLTDVFFTFLESNWYYFDEQWFRKLLAEVYMNKTFAPQRIPCTTICLVLLVLALASTFEHLSRPTNLRNMTQVTPGNAFYMQASILIPRVLASNSVESAICCLLMSLYILGTEDISHHHMYLSLALSRAVGLSMHRDGIGNDETPRAYEMKVRLFWTIYSIERQTSMIMGLPTMLNLKDITVLLPQERLDLDTDGFQRVHRLIAFTTLTMLADEIINTSRIEQSPETYNRACSRLESWKHSAPAHLLTTGNSSFRANAHLDISYNMIWVNIGRGASLRLVHKRLYPVARESRSQEHDEILLRTHDLVKRCTTAATIVIDLIHQLHSRNLLARFSFTDLHTCSSAVIVLLLNTLLRPLHDQLLSITQGIDALRYMAEESTLAMKALQLIECLREGVDRATGMADKDNQLSQQHPPLSMTVSREFSQPDVTELVPSVPHADTLNNTTYDTATPEFPPLDLSIFADLEPSLLEYSEQDLSLFGFNGFESTFDSGFKF